MRARKEFCPYVYDIEDYRDPKRKAIYGIQLPYYVHPEDPKLRTHWTLRDNETNVIIIDNDEVYKDNQTLEISDLIPPPDSFRLSVRMYRTLGARAIVQPASYRLQIIRGNYYISIHCHFLKIR